MAIFAVFMLVYQQRNVPKIAIFKHGLTNPFIETGQGIGIRL
tara:strand:- start:7211 stop:7336 length:126 start_codon:yes stop_codon:yes gene_type:complete